MIPGPVALAIVLAASAVLVAVWRYADTLATRRRNDRPLPESSVTAARRMAGKDRW